MRISYLADEDLRRAIVLGVRRREPAVSFALARGVGAAGKKDPEVLQIAADQNRVLVSHDLRTLRRHFEEFTSHRNSPGVILIPQKLPVGSSIEELLLIWLASEPEDWVNQIRFLPL